MFGLSERLQLIASMVPNGARVCDVGTDHGYLAAALFKSGRVKSVIATDIKEKPLAHARESIKRLGAEGVDLRLCDGLEGLRNDEADTVIVAGMGGEVIAGILDRASWLKNDNITLILQPMTSAWELRRYLYKEGFDILKEPTLAENGKVYSVMLARYDGKEHSVDAFSCLVGKIGNNTESDREYLKKQYKRCNTCAVKLYGISGKEKEYEEYSLVAKEIKLALGDTDGV